MIDATVNIAAGSRVLVLAPHPDDFDANAVTLRRLLNKGCRIDLLVLSAGESGVDDDYARARLPLTKADIREHEQIASCKQFGLARRHIRFLRLPVDAQGAILADSRAFDAIRSVALRLRPDLIILPHANDTNLDHQRAAGLVCQLIGRTDLEPRLYFNRDPKTIAMRIDCVTAFAQDEADWKRQLLRCHDSQQQRNLRTRRHGFDDRILRANARAAVEAGVPHPFAEVFECDKADCAR